MGSTGGSPVALPAFQPVLQPVAQFLSTNVFFNFEDAFSKGGNALSVRECLFEVNTYESGL